MVESSIQETELIERLQDPATRSEAFKVLVKQYQERLYWHIRGLVMLHHDADDALQNTFIKVFRNIDKFRGQSKLYTWLYRIATNEAIDLLKQRSRKSGMDYGELQEHLVSQLEADPYFDGDKVQLELQKVLAQLPEKQKIVFSLKYFEELKYSEMSEILDTSEGALKTSYHIAVQKIKKHFIDLGLNHLWT